MQKIIWVFTIILIGLGFAPYKFPGDADKITSDQILVIPDESTCTPGLRVVKGSLNVPDNLKLLIKNVWVLRATGNSTPATHLQNGGDVASYLEDSYILSGKVVGYDTSFYKICGEYCALYKVSDWSPLEYHANFWTFSPIFSLIYFLALFAFTVASIMLLISKLWPIKN